MSGREEATGDPRQEGASSGVGPPPPLPDITAPAGGYRASRPAVPPVPPVPRVVPEIMRPTIDVAEVPAASRIPGAPTPDYGRLPTAPVATAAFGPSESAAGESDAAQWAPLGPLRPLVGPWALGLAVVALGASLLVGWMLPLGLIAIVVAIVALRRPLESRALGVWALVLGSVSVLYSAGWLLWAAWRAGLLPG